MANIAIFMLPEKGHINSAFKIAKSLMSRGHRVYFLQLPEFEQYIRSQGLDFIPVFENIFPKGYKFSRHCSTYESISARIEEEAVACGITRIALLKRELINKFESINPHLLILDVFNRINPRGLDIKLPYIFLNPTLISPSYTPQAPILILCPEEFDLPNTNRASQLYYVEASVDLRRNETRFPWNKLSGDKPLIYCSLGTQSHWSRVNTSNEANQRARKHFLQMVINAIGNNSNWQLILSVPDLLHPQDFHPVPSNVLLVDSCSQLDILQRTTLAITHGGLNTIKECVFFEIPMIVFPLAGDQFMNADRVVHHQLGIKGNIENASEELILSLINKIVNDPIYRSKVKIMNEKFRRAENEGRAIKFIEYALTIV
jgi:UDP:flavonoid glycosyltransferase YjiC (YdhE family)